MQDASSYPVSFSVDYPERELDWLTTLFRPLLALPILLLLGTVAGQTSGWGHQDGAQVAAGTGGVLVWGRCSCWCFGGSIPVVVRLEPGAAAVHQSGRGVPGADG